MIPLGLPAKKSVLKGLRAGERVALSGILYAARDQAHLRLLKTLDAPPFPLENAAIYYVGPTPAKPGKITGSAGPTSSYRMDEAAIPLIGKGVNIMIGKGERDASIRDACAEYGAVYLMATGGAGALLASKIASSRVIAYEDLGPEAVRELVVKDFPCLVAYDTHGNSIFRSDDT